MKRVILIAALAACTACAPSSELTRLDREYQRLDYYESVFAPMASSCNSAGGFLIFEDTTRTSTRHKDLSYSDMRMAVMRGCAGT